MPTLLKGAIICSHGIFGSVHSFDKMLKMENNYLFKSTYGCCGLYSNNSRVYLTAEYFTNHNLKTTLKNLITQNKNRNKFIPVDL